MFTHREQLQSSLLAWERLIDVLSVKYVQWLEEENNGAAAEEALAYLKERIDYCFAQWDYTRKLLTALPPLAELPVSLA